jgi:NAD-dependent DNA ligase
MNESFIKKKEYDELQKNLEIIKNNRGDILKLENIFSTINVNDLIKLKLHCSDIYYNTGEDNILEDIEYDLLEKIIITKKPDYKLTIGSIIRDKNKKIKLPVYMCSLDKIKITDNIKIKQFGNDKNNYIIQDKLDGVSCLLVYNNDNINMFTRGDGIIGSDISILTKYITGIPKNKNLNVIIRGELIIKKSEFTKCEKYSNPRNMVSGIINSRKICRNVEKIRFVSYEIITTTEFQQKPTEQIENLKKYGFEVVSYTKKYDITPEKLFDILKNRRECSEYCIDGLVIQSDKPYRRVTENNPKYSLAFKHNFTDNIKQTEVISVEWNVSKWGILKPRIALKPVVIDDVKIGFTTGFNAKFVKKNKIGKGTIVNICRSGDVIPYITSVVKSTSPDLPSIPYTWSKNNVDIFINNKKDEKIHIKQILYFFQNLGVKYMNLSTFQKLYENGFDTIETIFNMSSSDIENIKGFNKLSSEKIVKTIYNSRKRLTPVNILSYSSVFGIGLGEKKIKILLNNIPELLTETENDDILISKIMKIKGFSEISAKKIVNNLVKCKNIVKKLTPYYINDELNTNDTIIEKYNVNIDFTNKKVVFTGFRDKNLEQYIENSGGKVVQSVSTKTDYVIYKQDSTSSKVKKAKTLNIQLLKLEDIVKL